jgi:hypothetical protein
MPHIFFIWGSVILNERGSIFHEYREFFNWNIGTDAPGITEARWAPVLVYLLLVLKNLRKGKHFSFIFLKWIMYELELVKKRKVLHIHLPFPLSVAVWDHKVSESASKVFSTTLTKAFLYPVVQSKLTQEEKHLSDCVPMNSKICEF